jgi:glutamyl-tRNA synthetase
MIQPRVTKLSAIAEMTQFLVEVGSYDTALYEHVKSKSTLESSRLVLKEAVGIFAQIDPWNEETIRQALVDYGARANLKTGTVMWPIRVALSGLQSTPGGAIEIAAVLGRAEVTRRIETVLALLGNQ